MFECPPGYRLYADVVSRFEAVRADGYGLTARCPFPERHAHGDRTPSCRLWLGVNGALVARCYGCGAQFEELAAAIGLPADAWFADKGVKVNAPAVRHPRPKEVDRYEYRDAAGEIIAVKVRWEPGWEGRKKDFSWKRHLPAAVRAKAEKDGLLKPGQAAVVTGKDCLSAGWFARQREVNGVAVFALVTDADNHAFELPAAAVGLYRLPELLAAPQATPVLVVEGEKDAETLRSLGFVATTGPAGKGKWLSAWAADFAGRRVVAVPDRDPSDAAFEYATRVLASAVYYRSASVRLVELPIPELKPDNRGGDITDWVERKRAAGVVGTGELRAAVAALCKGFPEYTRQG